MGDKIIIQFDRKDLEGKCKTCLKYKYSIKNNKNYKLIYDDKYFSLYEKMKK